MARYLPILFSLLTALSLQAQQPAAPVLVVLREQPQKEVFARMEGASFLRMELANSEWQQAVSRVIHVEGEMDRARAKVDAAILETRRAAMKEIGERVGPSQQSVRARLESLRATNIRGLTAINAMIAEADPAALELIALHPDVAFVRPLEEVHSLLDISAPTMGVGAFWNNGFTGKGETVAVLDSGVRTSHLAFASRKLTTQTFAGTFSRSTCFDDIPDSVEDRAGHGTHVAGIVASGGTTQFPALIGVARELGTLVVLKVMFRSKTIPGMCTPGASGSTADIFAGIDWALNNTSARIFNFSLGGDATGDDSGGAPVFDLLADAFNVSLAIAAGNEGPRASTVGTPGIAYNILSVANVDDRNTLTRADDIIAPSSSRGPTLGGRAKPDIAAPGSRIRSTDFESNGFVEQTGTSMASPHVAGAMALLYSAGVNDPLSVRALLLNSSDGNGWNADVGWGILNLTRAQQNLGNVVRGSVSGNSVKFYRGRINSDFKATLTWNRHVSVVGQSLQTVLNNLNLEVFSRLDGASLRRSDSTINNVEQVQTASRGEALVKVSARDRLLGGVASEPYAVAFSEGGFSEVTGPSLSATCTPPANAAASSTFAVTCRISNSGGLDAVGLSGVLEVSSDFRSALYVPPGQNPQVPSLNLQAIAPASQGTATFTLIAPAAAGRYDLTFRFSANAFGESFSVAAPVSVTVSAAATLSPLTVSPAQLEFTFRTGGAALAVQTLALAAAGTGLTYTATASSSGNWLSVAAASGSLPASLRVSVNPQGLEAGNYAGTITVSAPGTANSPFTIPVTLRVETPVTATLANKMTTREVPGSCAVPTTVNSFLPTDTRAFVWFLVTGAAQGDRATVEWVGPDGVVHQTGVWEPVVSAGSWCFNSSISVAGGSAASKVGAWQVRVTWNGAAFFTLDFTITSPVSVRKSLVTRAVEGGTCTEPEPATTLYSTDKEGFAWFILDRTKGGERVRYEFKSPSQRVAASARWDPISAAGSWCFRSNALPIAGTVNAAQIGTWTFQIFVDDELMATVPFELVKGFTVEKHLMTKSVEGSGCSEPPLAGAFFRGDNRAIVWFLVSNPTEGDVAETEWFNPKGDSYTTSVFDPVPQSGGSRCYWAWINVADNVPASTFGEWQVRVKWNGNEVFTEKFDILSVNVTNRMTTNVIPEGTGCPTPTPVTLFSTTDEFVRVWWFAGGAAAGDTARAEWIRPNGVVGFRSTWDPLARAGNFCFNGPLRIAGSTVTTTPGDWTVRVFWNDVFLFNQPFTVQAPEGNAEGTISVKVEDSAVAPAAERTEAVFAASAQDSAISTSRGGGASSMPAERRSPPRMRIQDARPAPMPVPR